MYGKKLAKRLNSVQQENENKKIELKRKNEMKKMAKKRN